MEIDVDVDRDRINKMSSDELLSVETFEMIVNKKDDFDRKTCESLCLAQAKKLHIVSGFKELLKAYKLKLAQLRGVSKGNKTQFIDQPITLNCGDWICDISGVKKNQYKATDGNYETKFATSIPVLVTEILENIDDGIEKIRIAYFKNGWKSLLCNRSTVASNNKIIELADKGIEVTSDNAKLLVKYISDLVTLNLDVIPRYRAVSKMGWQGNEFMPYSDVKFDGEESYKHIYEAITSRGDYDKWINYVGELRQNIYFRLQLATSFASPILSKINALPFILHLWGGTGSGKTVGMMVAMSIWGNPTLGKLIRTMNMTENSMMAISDMLNNIPFAGDELQTIKTQMGYDRLIMRVTEGIGRDRMKYDKLQKSHTWKCSFLFTGEEPCTNDNSNGGAKNRVISINCEGKVVDKGNDVVNFISENYGLIGEKYVNLIKTEDLQTQYSEIFKNVLETCDTTEKQAMAMSCLLLADKLSSKYFFGTEPLKIDDVKGFLTSSKEVDVSERSHEFVINLIAANNSKFADNAVGEIWGRIDGSSVYINKTILTKLMAENGFVFDSVKKDWLNKGYLVANTQGRLVHSTRCNGIKASYIKLIVPDNVSDLPAPF